MKKFISLATGLLAILISVILMHNIYDSAKKKSLKQLHTQQDLLLVHASNQFTTHVKNQMKQLTLKLNLECTSQKACTDFIRNMYHKHDGHMLGVEYRHMNTVINMGLKMTPETIKTFGSPYNIQRHDISLKRLNSSVSIYLHIPQIAEDTLGKACLFELGCTWLIAPDGYVLYHSNKGATGLNISTFLTNLEGGPDVLKDINARVIGTRRFMGYASPAKVKKIAKHINFRPIIVNGEPWTVAVLTPESKLIANFSALRQDMVILQLFIILVTAGFVYHHYRTNLYMSRMKITMEADYKVLKEKEEKEFLFDAVPVHVWQIDNEMNILNLNQAAADFFIQTKPELIGQNCDHLFGQNSTFNNNIATEIAKDLNTSRSFVFESNYGHKNNLWLKADVFTFDEKSQDKNTILLIITDITDLKHTQLQLAKEKGQLHTILENLTDGVITLDMAQHVTMCNTAAIQILGIDEKQVLGEQINKVLQSVNPTSGRPVNDPIELILNQSHNTERETHLLCHRSDGTDRHVEAFATYITDNQQNKTGIVINIRDITLRHAYDKELQKAEQMKSISVMASGIAHDFNNYIASTLSNINLAETLIAKTHQSYHILSSMKEASKNAAGLAKQLQYFSQDDRPSRRVVSLSSIIENSVSFSVTGSLVSTQIDLPTNLWNVNVDASQISQIFSNITINAVQAMSNNGHIAVTAKNVEIRSLQIPGLSSGNYVQISFTDNGCGITETDSEQIFTPYFTTKKSGSGLGLAVSYSIIQKHDGTITVESAPEKGTSFHVFLPATSEQIVPAKPKINEPCDGNYHMLILEDDKYFSSSIKLYLENYGHQVTMTGHSEEAFDAYINQNKMGKMYDIVILDYIVPGNQNGCTLLQMMRQVDDRVPAILTTGLSSDPVIDRYKEYGFSKLLHKPFDMDDLCQSIHDVIKRNNT